MQPSMLRSKPIHYTSSTIRASVSLPSFHLLPLRTTPFLTRIISAPSPIMVCVRDPLLSLSTFLFSRAIFLASRLAKTLFSRARTLRRMSKKENTSSFSFESEVRTTGWNAINRLAIITRSDIGTVR